MFALDLLYSVLLSASVSTNATAQEVKISQATPGYNYYNRPSADLNTHDTDLRDCVPTAYSMNAEERKRGGSKAGLFESIIADAAQKGIFASALENCMVVKGWRVVSLDESTGKQWEGLPPKALRIILSGQVGALNPIGRVVRWWNNDAARASASRFVLRPPANSKQLGLRSLAGSENTFGPALPAFAPPAWMTRTVPSKEWDLSRPGRALIVIKMKGVGPKNGVSLSFERVGGDNSKPKPSFVTFQHGLSGSRQDGKFYVFEVDPGIWRLAVIHALNLCLGAPAFEVKAGEVIYGGSFDLASEAIGPDTDLGEPRTFLAGHLIAQRLQPAKYRNGVVQPCSGTGSIYALEVPGAPFAQDYRWGGRAGNAGSAISGGVE